MSVVGEVRERVRAGALLAGQAPVVVMLSGGRDSVCLLDVATALCGSERVRALHVNYGLRPAADGDEAHCRALCAQLGVEIEIVRAERDAKASGNLHAWAREVRYHAAGELAERLDAPPRAAGSPSAAAAVDASVAGAGVAGAGVAGAAARIAVGHTATDQVETILYRLAASPGRRALLGMPERDGRLVRPLLAVEREQTAAYCRERSLSWREDESNDRSEFARARVRHGLLPALEAVHPAAPANVLRTAALLREESELIDALVDAELDARSSVEMTRLAELPNALARQVAIRLAERAAGTFVPQAGERVGELIELWRRGGPAELHIGGLVGARVADGRLSMWRIQPRPQHPRRADGERRQ